MGWPRVIKHSKGKSSFIEDFSIAFWLFNSLPWYSWPIEIDGLPGFTC